MTTGRYIQMKLVDKPCEGQLIDQSGLPVACTDERVFELLHSNGKSFHLCEYHIEVLWGVWLPFREAIRDIWPVRR